MATTSNWSEPVVRRLIDGSGGQPPERLIERFADSLRADARQDRLPIRTDLIASVKGIKRHVRRAVDYSGRIYADENGQLRMDICGDDTEPRQRFTEAHELMHTAFPGFTEERRYRLDVTAERNAPNRQEEYLCDVGAAALLMPRELVRDHYDARDGFAAVERLATDAHVSIEAAANRLVTLSDEPIVLLCLAIAHKPADQAALRKGRLVAPRLRVRYALARYVDVYVPRHKSAEDDSVLLAASDSGREEQGQEPLPGTAGMVFSVRAKSYGGRVFAYAWPLS